jgi:hypothetical protein
LVLTSAAPPDVLLRVIVHGWLEKSTLPNFGMSYEHSIMSTV